MIIINKICSYELQVFGEILDEISRKKNSISNLIIFNKHLVEGILKISIIILRQTSVFVS